MIASGPFRPAADLSSTPYSKDWIVPGIIPQDGVVILASAPKTGKTCFATALGRAVAKGEPFLGQPVDQAPVLWCAHEEIPRERYLLHQGLTVEDPFLIAYPGTLPPLVHRLPKTDRFGRRDLRDFDEPFIFKHACEVGAKLIVIDCLHAAVEGGSLADNTVARAVMNTLRVWSFQLHVAVLVLHHLTKSGTRGLTAERFADSAQILAASSCHFFMDREPESENRSRIILHGKGRHPAPAPRLDIISEGILDYRLATDTKEDLPRKRLTTEERILELLSNGWVLTAMEIAKKLQLHPSTVRHSIGILKAAGSVATTKSGERNHRYAIPD